MLDELRKKGFKYRSVDHIYSGMKIAPEEVGIIAKWLPEIYLEHPGTGDLLCRSLKFTNEPFDSGFLIGLFESPDYDLSIKWGIGNTIMLSKTKDVSGWVKDQLLNKPYSLERTSLFDNLLKKGVFKDKQELIGFLKKVFDKYKNYDEYLKIFEKNSTKEDVEFLRKKAKEIIESKLNKKLLKMIEKISSKK